MKYEVTRACGHTETVQIYGSAAERENEVKWYETTDCKDCYQKDQNADCDEIEMLYSEYKKEYADCQTKANSYDKKAKTIVVFVPKKEVVEEKAAAESEIIEEFKAAGCHESWFPKYFEVGSKGLKEMYDRFIRASQGKELGEDERKGKEAMEKAIEILKKHNR